MKQDEDNHAGWPSQQVIDGLVELTIAETGNIRICGAVEICVNGSAIFVEDPLPVGDDEDVASNEALERARLIAAAPELFEALQEATDSLMGKGILKSGHTDAVIAQARAALTKARK